MSEVMAEPEGLWAVVEQKHATGFSYLVKAPGGYGVWWYPIGSEDGWSWEQVVGWGHELRLVRSGIREEPPHTYEELNPGQWVCKDCGKTDASPAVERCTR